MQDITTYQLAELVEYQTTTQEVMGSNPSWTNTHSLSRKCCLSNNRELKQTRRRRKRERHLKM